MNFFVTRTAKAHQVAFIVCSSLRKRNDVVHLFHRSATSFLQALFTERMGCGITLPHLSPAPSVPFIGVRTSLVLIVLSGRLALMPWAVASVRKLWAPRPGAGMLGLHRHGSHLLPYKRPSRFMSAKALRPFPFFPSIPYHFPYCKTMEFTVIFSQHFL